MDKKQNRLLYLITCISILSLTTSQITLNKFNEFRPNGVIFHEYNEKTAENLKKIAENLTKDLGLKFKMNELGTVVVASSIKGDGIINIIVDSKVDGSIQSAAIEMNNYKNDIELNSITEEVVRYFSLNSKDSDKTLKTIDSLYKKLTSSEYLSSDEYKESLKEGSFYEFEELKDEKGNGDITETVEVIIDNPHSPTSGVEIRITFE